MITSARQLKDKIGNMTKDLNGVQKSEKAQMLIRVHLYVKVSLGNLVRSITQLLHRLEHPAHLMIQHQIRNDGADRDPEEEHDHRGPLRVQRGSPVQVDGNDCRQDDGKK